jgi:hypothetical protein
LQQQFEELLRAYREKQSLSSNQSIQEEEDEDKEERKRLEKNADLAKDIFRESFGDRLERTPTILTSMPFGQAVGMMAEWVSEVLLRRIDQVSFSTVKECSLRMRKLTSDPAGDAQSYWPFIKKVRVYLKAHILSKGLILADLPGLRDLNSARKAITERYIRNCHQIFVVVRIDRVITNESVKEVFDLATHVELSKVDIVCTRSEEANSSEAWHNWVEERATIEDMQETIDAEKQEVKSLNDEIEYERNSTSMTREKERVLLDLHGELRRVEKSLQAHEFELSSHIIKLRNDEVANRLKEIYRNHPAGTNLEVFCVSNKMYQENREKPARVASPYLQLSGIVELRGHCIGIVAQSRIRATQAFIKDKIPAFLGSVQLWIEAGFGNASAESKRKTLEAVSNIQLELDQVCTLGRFEHAQTVSRMLEVHH